MDFINDTPLSSLVSGGIGQLFEGISARRNYKYQQKAAEEDLRRQKDFYKYSYDYSFDKQAAYNDPAAVRSRLAAAGINPFATGLDPTTGGSADASPGALGSSGTAAYGGSHDPISSAQSRLMNAQASKIEAETPGKGDFLDRYTSETRSIDLSNISKDLNNAITRWDADFKEVLKGLEVAGASASLDNLYAQYRHLLSQTVNEWDTHHRNPLVVEQLNNELGLMCLQGGLILAETSNYSYRNLDLFASAMEAFQNTQNMNEVFKRLQMENMTLDQEKALRQAEFEWQTWESSRGKNSGYGKTMYRLGQFTGMLGNVFSGHAGYYGSRSSASPKTIPAVFKR
ncbi:MAG: hypothetical protein [Microviridae sp.]|nr:MAG: hypothetical protein [Microviridae sp.]